MATEMGGVSRRNDRLGEDVTSLDQPPPPLGETHQEGHLKVTLEVVLTFPGVPLLRVRLGSTRPDRLD